VFFRRERDGSRTVLASFRQLLLLVFALAFAACPAQAQSEDVAAFYRGKTISVVNPFGEGGRNSVLVRLVTEHLPRHIPGRPGGVLQLMPGAGGLRQMAHLYNVAPRDGTVIGLMYDNMPIVQALATDDSLKFDVRRLPALGSLGKGDAGVLGILKRAGVATLEDARAKTAVFGAVGASSAQAYLPLIMNKLFGTRFKVIPGYRGTGEIYLAMERGEVDGVYGALEVMEEVRPDWVKEQRFNWLAQLYEVRSPQLPDVPLLQELAQRPIDKAAFRLLALARAPGKVFITTPEVPPARLAALRAAFAAMMQDSAFLADLARTTQPPDPRSWQDAERIIRETVDTPADVLAYVRELLPAGAGQ
jgi:tripartite-type tricarboxylate transporter receptor subunit TctC